MSKAQLPRLGKWNVMRRVAGVVDRGSLDKFGLVPEPKPASKSWLDLACEAAVRFGHRMRDEWKAGEADAQRGDVPLEDDASPPKKPKPAPLPKPDWCEILQVPPTATEEEIKRAYRRLIKENHPDKAAHLSPEEQAAIERAAKQLNDAYERAMSR